MNHSTHCMVKEKNYIIPIKNQPSPMKGLFSNQYELHTNCFDPSNHSPPNDFMHKLMKRLTIYNEVDYSIHNK